MIPILFLSGLCVLTSVPSSIGIDSTACIEPWGQAVSLAPILRAELARRGGAPKVFSVPLENAEDPKVVVVVTGCSPEGLVDVALRLHEALYLRQLDLSDAQQTARTRTLSLLLADLIRAGRAGLLASTAPPVSAAPPQEVRVPHVLPSDISTREDPTPQAPSNSRGYTPVSTRNERLAYFAPLHFAMLADGTLVQQQQRIFAGAQADITIEHRGFFIEGGLGLIGSQANVRQGGIDAWVGSLIINGGWLKPWRNMHLGGALGVRPSFVFASGNATTTENVSRTAWDVAVDAEFMLRGIWRCTKALGLRVEMGAGYTFSGLEARVGPKPVLSWARWRFPVRVGLVLALGGY